MNAWVLHDINDFRLEGAEKPTPGSSEVLVEVKAAGICGSDIPRVYQNGTYSFLPTHPGT
jgi:L-iditol 2-dehydrogenase